MVLAEPLQVTLRVVQVLERLGVDYLVGGSLASSLHGVPRATQDVDLVAMLRLHHVDSFVAALAPNFYVDADMVRDAIRHFASFNVIDMTTMMKVDIFVAGRDALQREEMARRESYALDEDVNLWVASPEDIVLQKLDWYEKGNRISDRQWKDPSPEKKVHCDDEFDVYAASFGDAGSVDPSRYMSYAVCVANNCAADCGFGDLLDCGRYDPNILPAEDVEATVRAHEFYWAEIQGPPFVGVQVTACGLNDLDCSDALGSDVTDGNGLANLTIPRTQNSVYFQVEVPSPLSSGSDGDLVRAISYPPLPFHIDTAFSFAIGPAVSSYTSPEAPGGLVWTPGTGLVFAAGRDCYGAIARDLVCSIPDDPDAGVGHYSYPPEFGQFPSSDRSSGYQAAFVNVTPGGSAQKARHLERGIMVASRWLGIIARGRRKAR